MTKPIVFLIDPPLVGHTGMYMFDLNWPYNLLPIVALIQIKHVLSSLSYQLATYAEYDRHGRESPSGYGPLVPS